MTREEFEGMCSQLPKVFSEDQAPALQGPQFKMEGAIGLCFAHSQAGDMTTVLLAPLDDIRQQDLAQGTVLLAVNSGVAFRSPEVQRAMIYVADMVAREYMRLIDAGEPGELHPPVTAPVQ